MNKKKTVEELKQSIQELQKENKNLRENNAIVEQCTIQMREMFPEEWDSRQRSKKRISSRQCRTRTLARLAIINLHLNLNKNKRKKNGKILQSLK